MARVSRKSYTIERGRGATYVTRSGWTVYGHDRYPRGSVFAGRHRRTWEGHFPTVEAAVAAFPSAEVIPGTTYEDIGSVVAHLPDTPDW